MIVIRIIVVPIISVPTEETQERCDFHVECQCLALKLARFGLTGLTFVVRAS